jgi:DNA-binding transcriptional ArsR family regulator
MSDFDEEVYSTMFNALRHGVRRNILRMLEGGELSFTTIAERLNLSSSHLTYHLDSLKELVSKTDSGYSLSLFGVAAVDMMRKVEEPPDSRVFGARNQRYIIVGLVAALVIVSGLYGTTYFEAAGLRSLGRQQEVLVEALREEYEPFASLSELIDTRPFTHFSRGLYAVSGWTLSYGHDTSKEFSHEENYYPPYFYAAFYAPVDNLTLYLQPGKYFPMGEFSYPLTLQRGNAWMNESAVRVEQTYPDLNITEVMWQSPVIWRMNVTDTTQLEVPLPSEGWYTLCMTGPIRKTRAGATRYKGGIYSVVNGTIVVAEHVDIWLDFKLLRGGDEVLYGVWDRG